jgi:hypothetical protein
MDIETGARLPVLSRPEVENWLLLEHGVVEEVVSSSLEHGVVEEVVSSSGLRQSMLGR